MIFKTTAYKWRKLSTDPNVMKKGPVNYHQDSDINRYCGHVVHRHWNLH